MQKVATIAASIAALALTVFASNASAQTWAPVTDGWTLSGNLNVQQTLSLNCDVTGHAKTTSSNTGTIDAFNFVPGSSACAVLGENLPWSIAPLAVGPSGGKGVRITLSVTALFTTCAGYVDGDYDNAGTISFPVGSQVMGGGSTCYLDGEVVLTPDHGNTQTLIIS